MDECAMSYSLKNIFMITRKAIGYVLVMGYALFFSSCHSKLSPHDSTQNSSQHRILNREIRDGQGNLQLLGECTRFRLEQAPFNDWFVKNYQDYRVDSATADRLKPALSGRRFRIFMGTWCGDSRREVPRIFKILDYCGVAPSRIQLIMVSGADSTIKQSPDHEEKGLDIFRVPDLFVLDKGHELGRVVESPVSSLEKDLLALTTDAPYTPHYPGADRLIHVFREEKMDQIEQELPTLAGQIKPLVRNPNELKGYAHVMNVAGEHRKADIILRINALIFPDQK